MFAPRAVRIRLLRYRLNDLAPGLFLFYLSVDFRRDHISPAANRRMYPSARREMLAAIESGLSTLIFFFFFFFNRLFDRAYLSKDVFVSDNHKSFLSFLTLAKKRGEFTLKIILFIEDFTFDSMLFP